MPQEPDQPDDEQPEVMGGQPVFTIAAVQTAVVAVFAVLIAFGVPVSDEQQAAVLKLYGAVAPLAFGVWTWRKVRPVKKVS